MSLLKRTAIGSYGLAAAILLMASPVFAQFRPRPMSDPATGESYYVEASAGFWNTSSDMSISSESLGIVGSIIDFKTDLGLESGRFREVKLVLRPATKHKFRFEYIPIRMSATDHPLTRDIVFNGQRYSLTVPVDSTFEWKAYRFAYEYDFLTRDRWFVGFLLDAKYTDVAAQLNTAFIEEYVRARAPLPAIGGIGRVYVVPNISITGEFTRIPVREQITEDISGRYTDFELYGTVNFTNNVGVQVGHRKLDVGYKFDADSGTFKVKGLYFGIVARY